VQNNNAQTMPSLRFAQARI